MDRKCENCLWADNCNYGRPCQYYTPLDFKEIFEERDEARLELRYREDWTEYAEYCDGVYFF